jgi:hypothetical protein
VGWILTVRHLASITTRLQAIIPRAAVSRSEGIGRLMNMRRNRSLLWTWLIWIVLAHLLISMDGFAHAQANVPLSAAANLFVYVVILAGPLLGLALAWKARTAGSVVIALAMAGSLVFGLVNHFVLSSPDHVEHVVPQWRALFATTAVLLALTEAVGFGLAVRVVREGK